MNMELSFSPLLLGGLLSAQEPRSAANPMQEFLPSSFHQWNVSEPPRSYPLTRIFEYMDGAGEVYLAYGFKDILVERYAAAGQEEILVELYDMGSPKGAFGAFTYMMGRGPAVSIGQDAEYKSGLLCFWQGRYFGYIKIEKENEEAKAAVLEMGKTIALAIHEKGERPALLRCLPEGEYMPTTLRYFFKNEILNNHFTIADGNILQLNEETEGVLVRIESDKSYLLLIAYPSEARADTAYESFLTHFMPDARESAIIRTPKATWTACLKQKAHISVVFDAATKEQASHVLDSVKRRLP